MLLSTCFGQMIYPFVVSVAPFFFFWHGITLAFTSNVDKALCLLDIVKAMAILAQGLH